MKDMKSLHAVSVVDFPFDLRLVEDFPAYWGLGAEIIVTDQNGLSYGGVLHYNSSGSRMNITDYSGSISYDLLVERIAVGPTVRYMPEMNKRYSMGIGGSLICSFSNLEFRYSLSVLGLTDIQSENFSSASGQIRAAWIHRFRLTKTMYVIAQVGYEQDLLSSKLFFEGNNDAWLLNPDGTEAALDWSGVRLQLALGLRIPTESK